MTLTRSTRIAVVGLAVGLLTAGVTAAVTLTDVRATQEAADAGLIVQDLKWFYEDARRNMIAAAEKMPAEDYGFRPTPDVRPFGGIVGHIANWQYTNCALVKGERNPNATNFEPSGSKSDLVAALKAAYAYCDTVFAGMSITALSTQMRSGRSTTFPAMSAIAHPYLHYGNLVTYLRLKGLVPPSSDR